MGEEGWRKLELKGSLALLSPQLRPTTESPWRTPGRTACRGVWAEHQGWEPSPCAATRDSQASGLGPALRGRGGRAGARVPPRPGRWRPQSPPSGASRSGVAAAVPKAQAARRAGLSTWAETTWFRWQGSKAEPSSPPGPPTAPLPRPRKGHAHKNFCHTINIFAFPPTFPMGYQLQNS